MHSFRKTIIALLLILIFSTVVYASSEKGRVLSSTYDTKISVVSRDVYVEIVSDPASITKGLSGRKDIGKNQGMLFDSGYENTYPAFWMKDMKFAIDIIWIDDGRVVHIDEHVQPPTPGTADFEIPKYRPPVPVDHVLEVPAGFSNQNSIAVGDLVNLNAEK